MQRPRTLGRGQLTDAAPGGMAMSAPAPFTGGNTRPATESGAGRA